MDILHGSRRPDGPNKDSSGRLGLLRFNLRRQSAAQVPASPHAKPNVMLEARVCECGLVRIYALATQVIRPGDSLVCVQCPWQWTALVAHFDGSHRSEGTGGAGVIVRKFCGDTSIVLEQTAYPLLDCPDSYHAEGFASSYAVHALARHFPSSPDVQECVIIGDNSSILNYWRRTARVRRPNSQPPNFRACRGAMFPGRRIRRLGGFSSLRWWVAR